MKKAITLTLALGGIIVFTFLAMPNLASLASAANNDAYPDPRAYPTADFNLQPVQTVRVVVQEDTADFVLYLRQIEAFDSLVSLSVQEVPTETQTSLYPAQLVPPGYSALMLTPSAWTAPGLYPFSVVGVGGGQQHSAQLALIVLPTSSGSTSAGSDQSGQVELGGTEGVTVTMDIPAGAFGETTTVTLKLLKRSEMPSTDPPAGQAFVRSFRVTADAPLAGGQSFNVTIYYQDGEVALLEEHLLRLHYWDTVSQSWQSDGLDTLALDPQANKVVVQLDRLADFTLTGFIGVEKVYIPLVIR